MGLEIKAEKRTISGKAVKRLRLEGKVPAVLYGHGITPCNILVLSNPFKKIYDEAGESTLLDLYIDGESHKVLIQDVQYNPLTDAITHVDFREVKMTEKLEAEISLKFIGEPRAVKDLGGVLVKNINAIKVRCLPQELVSEIEIDLSPLREFGNSIHVSDINISKEIEILTNLKEVVVTVIAPREDEVAPVAAEVDLSAIKTVGEEKKAAKDAEKKAEEAAKAEK